MREPKKITIDDLLGGHEKMIIPKYQRGYDWKSNQEVRDLFTDIFFCADSNENSNLFLGTMIFDVSKEDKKEIEVIDGQQRITTFIIILIACRVFIDKKIRKKDLIYQEIQPKILKEDLLSDVPDNKYFKLIASETIRDVFQEMSDKKWKGVFKDKIIDESGKKRQVKLQNRKIKPVFDFAYEEIKNYCTKDPSKKIKTFLEQVCRKTYIIKIAIEKKEEAFEIFERTNARGRNLEISDLLKNFLFSKNKEIEVEEIEQYWELIVRNSCNSILRMIKYFWVSRKGYIPNRDLYREIRKYADNIGINKFIEELKQFSSYYKAIASTKERQSIQDWLLENKIFKNEAYLNEAARSIRTLGMFNVTQTYPLIFSALKSYLTKKSNKPKELLSFLRFLESYHFINNKVCNRIGNEVEKTYAAYSEEFFSSNVFSGISNDLIKNQKEKIAPLLDFKANFESINYDDSDKKIIHYIFDKISNNKIKDGQREDLINYFYKEKGVIGSFDIEHVLSQTNETKIENPNVIHEIGNLLVIPKQINGIFGDASFKKKKDIILNPERHDNDKIRNISGYLREFAQKYKKKNVWNENDIRKRTNELAEVSYHQATEGYKY